MAKLESGFEKFSFVYVNCECLLSFSFFAFVTKCDTLRHLSPNQEIFVKKKVFVFSEKNYLTVFHQTSLLKCLDRCDRKSRPPKTITTRKRNPDPDFSGKLPEAEEADAAVKLARAVKLLHGVAFRIAYRGKNCRRVIKGTGSQNI